ncbi:MAG: hypothetical protein WD967_00170 [Candidatus Levyibacteriota bacterium]
MKKPALIITSLIFAILVLSVVRISVANRISTSGIELQNIEDQVASIKKENLILQEKLLTFSSFTQIASRAGELGFVPSRANLVISTSVPVALADTGQPIRR